MTTLSGLVAILDINGAITGYRDLGPVPVQVKDGRVLPVEDIRPPLGEGEDYGAPTVEKQAAKVVRTWPVVTEPTILSYADFRERWTPEELSSMAAALGSNPGVLEVVITARTQGHVNLSGKTAGDAKKLFVALGVLTKERADEVFKA